MITLEISKATAPLADYAQKVKTEPVVLTSGGKPIAALLSIEDADWESVKLNLNPKFIAVIEHSRARQRAEGGISSEEMRRRLGLTQATSLTHGNPD